MWQLVGGRVEVEKPGSTAQGSMFSDCHLKDSETMSLGHFLHRSWLTEGCFRSWKSDTQKENGRDYLLTAYLLSALGKDGTVRGECLGLALDPGTLTSQDLPERTLQRAETGNNSGFLSPHLMFHDLLPKVQANHRLHHPETSHNVHRIEKSREQTKHLEGCYAGE